MTVKIRYFANAIPILAGCAAAFWTDLSIWVDMKEGLIAFLGFLAASLVQIMPITANFLQSDELLMDDAVRLTESLKRQQYYWVGLLAFTIFALIVLIFSTVLVKKVEYVDIGLWGNWSVGLSSLITLLLVTSLSFVFLKMLGLFRGVLSLHDLRSEIILENARKRTERELVLVGEAGQGKPIDLPVEYGQIVSPPDQK